MVPAGDTARSSAILDWRASFAAQAAGERPASTRMGTGGTKCPSAGCNSMERDRSREVDQAHHWNGPASLAGAERSDLKRTPARGATDTAIVRVAREVAPACRPAGSAAAAGVRPTRTAAIGTPAQKSRVLFATQAPRNRVVGMGSSRSGLPEADALLRSGGI